MSEETARALAAAEAEEAEQRAIVDRLKQDVLKSIAAALPQNIDAYAKELSQKQPVATTKLGRDGVAALREALADAAQKLGSLLEASADKIDWNADYSGVAYGIRRFVSGSSLAPFNHALRSAGFTIDSKESVTGYELVSERRYPELEEALKLLAQKTNAVKAAKRADDQDAAASIWDESGKG